MLRIATIFVLLLAYLATTNHCALIEMLCAGDCVVAENCTHHDETAAGSGECFLEKPATPAPAALSFVKIIAALGAFLPAIMLWQCIHFLITKILFKLTAPRQLPADWLSLFYRRHFIYRAAGFARAP